MSFFTKTSSSSSSSSSSSFMGNSHTWHCAFFFLLGLFLGHIQVYRALITFPAVRDQTVETKTTTTTPNLESGWRTIEVFTNDTHNHLQHHLNGKGTPNQTRFSQVGQDSLVLNLLRHKRNGYFIDLAANDAVPLSNTLALELETDWTGLCIEPNPAYWYNLAYFRKCQVVVAIVGPNRSDVDFYYQGNEYGGIVGAEFDNKNNKKVQSRSVPQVTVSLLEIFERFQVPNHVDYLSLDVEGAESFIMDHFPFESYKFSILTVERPKDDLRALLHTKGYQFITNMSFWGETIWAHDSVMSELNLTALEDFVPLTQWPPRHHHN